MGFNLIVTILYALDLLLNVISPPRVEKFQRIFKTGSGRDYILVNYFFNKQHAGILHLNS
tara:strand:- start:1387 stop:1566 length:180 start_codon:yes stop_codon:yes gene_type:complete